MLQVHGGTTKEMIVRKVEKAYELARKNKEIALRFAGDAKPDMVRSTI